MATMNSVIEYIDGLKPNVYQENDKYRWIAQLDGMIAAEVHQEEAPEYHIPDGADNVALATRTSNANSWGADFYLSVHHNAGINGGSGGGIVTYVCKDGLTKKPEEKEPDTLYRVQVGAFKSKANAEKLKAELEEKGFQTYMVRA